MYKSGKIISLKSGKYSAKLVTVGAGIASLTYDDMNIVIPHNPREIALAHLGKFLSPWPNRLANGKYTFDGKSYQLPINDLNSNSAIHGLLAWKEWRIEDLNEDLAILQSNVTPIYGYPFLISVKAIFSLDKERGLSIKYIAQNVGNNVAPYGAGVHPYLSCDLEKIDNCNLKFLSDEVFVVDQNLNPQNLIGVDALNFNFNAPRLIANTVIDHTFKLKHKNSRLELFNNKLGVYLETNARWLQLYTGEKLERKGLAAEPMSCPPDAFNSEIDLIHLKPGETNILEFTVGRFK